MFEYDESEILWRIVTGQYEFLEFLPAYLHDTD